MLQHVTESRVFQTNRHLEKPSIVKYYKYCPLHLGRMELMFYFGCGAGAESYHQWAFGSTHADIYHALRRNIDV